MPSFRKTSDVSAFKIIFERCVAVRSTVGVNTTTSHSVHLNKEFSYRLKVNKLVH